MNSEKIVDILMIVIMVLFIGFMISIFSCTSTKYKANEINIYEAKKNPKVFKKEQDR